MRGTLNAVPIVISALVVTQCARPTFLPCDMVPLRGGGQGEFSRCAVRAADGTVSVGRQVLAAAYFEEGVSELRIGKEWFFVTPLGKTARALFFDNGADQFVEGLARIVLKGKVGFVDRELREAIPATWDFAFPFDGGLAMVCQGCVERQAFPGAEEHVMVGGKWGCIDRSGRLALPLVYTYETLPKEITHRH